MPKQDRQEDFYKRMQEAKRLKKIKLEQDQLNAEFEAHPERFNSPQPIIVKSDAELKMDKAFAELQTKLKAEQQTKTDRLTQAFEDIARKAQGL